VAGILFSTETEAGSVEAAGLAGEAHAARLSASKVRIKLVIFMFVLLIGIWRMDEGHANMFPRFRLSNVHSILEVGAFS
jgi:hypothetical protein